MSDGGTPALDTAARETLRRTTMVRLAAMMFLQYFAMGSTLPVLSLYLKDHLHFTGTQIGIVLGMSSVAAFFSPVVAALVADRRLSAERLLSVCHLVGAALMLLLSTREQFSQVLPIYLLYSMAFGPTVPLTNAITFHHLEGGNHKFGNTRVFGTVGWVAVAWLFGYFWLRGGGETMLSGRLPDALMLSAITSLVLGTYALTLPKRTIAPRTAPRLIPIDSLRVLVQPRILLLAAVALVIGIVDRYYYFGTGPFLRHLGFRDASIMPSMSLGQVVEIAAMAFLATLIKRIGVKRTMIIGISAQVLRFVAFSMGTSTPVVLFGIACHGIAFGFFFATVFITIDSYCDEHSRAGLHQLFTIISLGLGSLSAYLLAGVCFDAFVIKFQAGPNYRMFWMVPAVLSTVSLAAIAIAFPGGKER